MPSLNVEKLDLEKVQKIIRRYPVGREKSALLPILHLAQDAFGGWLSVEAMDYVASLLKLQPIEVYEVASFYTMFNLSETGQYVFQVCHTGPCCLVGSERIIKHLEKRLGIGVGETTPDGLFTLKTVECLASCGTAPVMQFGKKYVEHLTEEKLDHLIEELRAHAHSTRK
jgi:NADH-quinone oxidoreductase subunit E